MATKITPKGHENVGTGLAGLVQAVKSDKEASKAVATAPLEGNVTVPLQDLSDLMSLDLNTQQHGDDQIKRWISDAAVMAVNAGRAVVTGHVVLFRRDKSYGDTLDKGTKSRIALISRAAALTNVTDPTSNAFAVIVDAASGKAGSSRAVFSDRVRSAEADASKKAALSRSIKAAGATPAKVAPEPSAPNKPDTKSVKKSGKRTKTPSVRETVEAFLADSLSADTVKAMSKGDRDALRDVMAGWVTALS